jgi:DNA-binding GntR family transcriptional regulator
MILRGELPPGTAISRRVLAEHLGMSFLPASEAFQRLEYDGLLESWPRVGTRVRIPTQQDVRGNYVIREALESQSARLFAEKAGPAEREELEKMAREVDAMDRNPAVDLYEYFSLHERFHRRIAECTGCPALADAIVKTNTLIRTWQYAAIADFRPARRHVDLIKVLSSGNAEESDRVMRAHVRYGMDEVLRRMEPYFRGEYDPQAVFGGRRGRKPAGKTR